MDQWIVLWVGPATPPSPVPPLIPFFCQAPDVSCLQGRFATLLGFDCPLTNLTAGRLCSHNEDTKLTPWAGEPAFRPTFSDKVNTHSHFLLAYRTVGCRILPDTHIPLPYNLAHLLDNDSALAMEKYGSVPISPGCMAIFSIHAPHLPSNCFGDSMLNRGCPIGPASLLLLARFEIQTQSEVGAHWALGPSLRPPADLWLRGPRDETHVCSLSVPGRCSAMINFSFPCKTNSSSLHPRRAVGWTAARREARDGVSWTEGQRERTQSHMAVSLIEGTEERKGKDHRGEKGACYEQG
ncbi:hypothetical protein MHYP_G00166870 [Metynnis hypsauchen]